MWRGSHRVYTGGIAARQAAHTKGSPVLGTRPAARTTASASIHGSLPGVDGEARLAWVSQALCRSTDPDQLFVRGAAQRKAAVICRHCPVITECGADALDNRVEFGVWGGMTERQRRALLKQHPEVSSWADFFSVQRKQRIVS